MRSEFLIAAHIAVALSQGRVPVHPEKQPEKYTGYYHKPDPMLGFNEMPENFDWSNVEGETFLTPSWNQHIPQYCGGCWLHGTLSALQDRIKIANRGKHIPDVMLARQDIINCGEKYGYGHGCGGGSAHDVFEYMHRFGLPDSTCNNYLAKSQENQCDDEGRCMNCLFIHGDSNPHCWPVKKFTKYWVTKYTKVSGEQAIMSEVYRNGPVTCGLATPDDFDYYYHGETWKDLTGTNATDHDVEVVGWGVDPDGTKYWNIRNSWGTYWGVNGFFKLRRGQNDLRIEDSCDAGTVDVSELDDVLNGKLVGSQYGLITPEEKAKYLPDGWSKMTHNPKHWDSSGVPPWPQYPGPLPWEQPATTTAQQKSPPEDARKWPDSLDPKYKKMLDKGSGKQGEDAGKEAGGASGKDWESQLPAKYREEIENAENEGKDGGDKAADTGKHKKKNKSGKTSQKSEGDKKHTKDNEAEDQIPEKYREEIEKAEKSQKTAGEKDSKQPETHSKKSKKDHGPQTSGANAANPPPFRGPSYATGVLFGAAVGVVLGALGTKMYPRFARSGYQSL